MFLVLMIGININSCFSVEEASTSHPDRASSLAEHVVAGALFAIGTWCLVSGYPQMALRLYLCQLASAVLYRFLSRVHEPVRNCLES